MAAIIHVLVDLLLKGLGRMFLVLCLIFARYSPLLIGEHELASLKTSVSEPTELTHVRRYVATLIVNVNSYAH